MKDPNRVYVIRYKTNGECTVKDCHLPRLEDFAKNGSKGVYCRRHADRVKKVRCG